MQRLKPFNLTNSIDHDTIRNTHKLVYAGLETEGAFLYNGFTSAPGLFYGGTTNPSATTRLNYSGVFYATRLYDNAVRVSPQLASGTVNGTLRFTGTTNTAGGLNGGTSTPTATQRLNYNGHFYATKLHAGTTEVPLTSRAIAERSTSQSITSASWQTLVYNTETEDNLGEYNDTTGVFTCGAAGFYQVSAHIRFEATSDFDVTETAAMRIKVGASTYYQLDGFEMAASPTTWLGDLGGSRLVEAAASDTIEIQVIQSSGATIGLLTSAETNWVSIVRVQ